MSLSFHKTKTKKSLFVWKIKFVLDNSQIVDKLVAHPKVKIEIGSTSLHSLLRQFIQGGLVLRQCGKAFGV